MVQLGHINGPSWHLKWAELEFELGRDSDGQRWPDTLVKLYMYWLNLRERSSLIPRST